MERITYSEYYEVSIAVVEQCVEHNNAVKLTEQFLFSSLEHSGIAVNSGAIKTHLNSPCTSPRHCQVMTMRLVSNWLSAWAVFQRDLQFWPFSTTAFL